MIEIKNYCLELEEAHYKFATRMFGGRRKRRNSDYIYWKFKGKRGRELPNVKLAIKGNDVIGLFAAIPCKLKIGDTIVDAQWACHLIVDKAYRGKGVASLLYEALHKECVLTLGSNPSPSAEKSMIKDGYKKLKSSDKYFIPINIGVPFRIKGYPIKFLDNIKNPFLNVYMKKNILNKFEEVDIFKLDHELIFLRNTSERISISVDTEFKNWRFTPFKDYYPGIKAYKLKNKSTYFTGYINGKTYFITDFIVENKRDFNAIIALILEIIKNTNVEVIRFFNNDKELKMGVFKPIMIKYSTPNLIIYYTLKDNIENLVRGNAFYYTMQDSDENI